MVDLAALTVLTVHFRSAGTIEALCRDLTRQDHPNLNVVIVECGDDGSVAAAVPVLGSTRATILDPGANLGYCGGNNYGLSKRPIDGDVLIVNPDVRIPDPRALTTLHHALLENPRLGAVGPVIMTPDGLVEHADSTIDARLGLAIHTRTHLDAWPQDLSSVLHRVPWLDGCCWLLRGDAIDEVGSLDERFFLYCEEVDWSMRATDLSWTLGIVPSVRVDHVRSSSFRSTQKGAYYYWRNNFLLFHKHATSRVWMVGWLRRLVRFCVSPAHLRSRAAANALWGGVDAIRGRTGPRPGRGRA